MASQENKKRRVDSASNEDKRSAAAPDACPDPEAQIMALKAELAKEREERAKEVAELDKQNSVASLLQAMPLMTVNKACPPSMIENDAAHKIVEKYRSEMIHWSNLSEKERAATDKPVRFQFHEPAKIINEVLTPDKLDFHMNLRDGKGRLIKSSISTSFVESDRTMLYHHNETSPQDYIAFAIRDVIKCCGLRGTMVVKEATLFSLRPDLVVVVYEGRVLFAAEIKNPSISKDVFAAETVAGQTLDYLKGLKQMGIDQPFVLLSTYNESVIVRFDADHEAYAQHLSDGARNASHCPAERHKREGQHGGEKPDVSPSKGEHLQLKLPSISANKTTKRLFEEASLDPEDEDARTVCNNISTDSVGEFDYRERAVQYSQKFRVPNLYKALTLLLESSLVSVQASKESLKAFVPEDGSNLISELCTLSEDAFSWQHVRLEKVSYNIPPRFQKHQSYHVLCVLGQGGTGRSILCCSATGKMFVAKLFLIPSSTLYSEEERAKEIQKAIDEKQKMADNELQRWLDVAPECGKYCRTMKLNGMPALTMPFFPPIPLNKREKALDLIEARLTELAQEKGLAYEASDLRWGHFGCRWSENNEMEIALLDLGSLLNKTYNEEHIMSQIGRLRERMGKEDPSTPSPVLV